MSVAEDIVSIKEAIAGEWDDILITAHNLDTMISDAITWFETNETDFWTNSFKPAIEKVFADFEEVGKTTEEFVDEIKTAFSTSMATLESDFQPISNAISTFEGDIDGLKAFETLLGNFPTFPDIIPGIDAAAVKGIFEEVMGDRFSVAIKKIPPRSTSDNGSQDQNNQNAAAESALETMLENAFGDAFQTNVITKYGADIEGIATNIQNLISSKIVNDLETSVETIIGDLVKVDNPEKLTLAYIESNVKTLIENQLQNALDLATSLQASLDTDLGKIRAILNEILTLPAATDCDFVKFYQLIINDESKVPTLREAICLVVAIPLTLSSQAITGSNFAFPNSAYLTFDATARAKMSGLLSIIGIGIALSDKAYTTVTGSDGFWHTVIMGIVGTIQGGLSQLAFSPEKPTPINTSNMLWYYNWGASFGLSLAKWVYTAYWKANNPDDNILQSVQTKINEFCDEYTTQYDALMKIVSAVDNTYVPSKIHSLNDSLTSIQADIADISDKTNWTKGLNSFVGLNMNTAGTVAELTKIKGLISDNASGAQKETEDLKQVDTIGSKFNSLDIGFVWIRKSAKNVLIKSAGKAQSDNLLGVAAPVFDIISSLFVLSVQVYQYSQSTSSDKDTTLGKQVFLAIKGIFSDFVSLYYFKKKPLTTQQERDKTGIGNFMFMFNQFWAAANATTTLAFKVAFQSMKYDQTANTLTVDFNYDVSLAEGSNWKGAFDLGNINAHVHDVNPATGSNSSFVITLSQTLTKTSVDISVVANQLLDPWNHKVVASKTFTLSPQLSKASYDASAKTISASFDYAVTQVSGKQPYFCLSPTGTVTSATSEDNNSFTVDVKDALIGGAYTLSTLSGAFTDDNNNPVDASFIFTVPPKLSMASYDASAKTISVSFDSKVTQVSGKESYFSLSPSGTITKATPNGKKGFTLLLQNTLSAGPFTLSTASGAFTDDESNPVDASFIFTVPPKLSMASYDASAKTISVSFDSKVTQVSGKESYFSLSPSGTITKATPNGKKGFTLLLQNTLSAGPFTLSTASGAFTDDESNPVDSSIGFTVPTKKNS